VQRSLVKQLAIRLGRQKTATKSLVMMEQLGIRPSRQKMAAKSLSILKLLGVTFALAISTAVFAVGMGGINVGSGLGQQLKAEIELVSISKTEKTSLVARLASPEAYKDAGLEYPYGNKFRFQIESRADGEPYLKVSTDQPINDPFVIMLVELTWSSGKLLREYTFLLDPPGYVAEQPAQSAVQAVAPVIQSVPAVVPVVPAEQIAPVEQAALEQPTQAQPVPEQPAIVTPVEQAEPTVAASVPVEQTAPAEQAVPIAAEELPALNEWIAVKRGDTLRELADQYKLADVSLDRMLVALYRANADRFDGKNMNRIKAGKILRLPNQTEVEAVSQPQATKEIRAQAADWNAYRQKLASAAEIRMPPQASQQIATGKISSSVADKAPVVKESARDVLKLSKGEAPGDGIASAGASSKVESVQEKKNAAQEEAIAKSKALKEEQERAAMLEKNIQDLQRLAKLKSEAAALAQPPKTDAPAVVAASEVAVASAEKPKPKPKPIVVEPEPLMDQIMTSVKPVLDEPLYLAGGAALLLGLGGLGFMINRRKKKPFNEIIENSGEEDAGNFSPDASSTPGHIATPVVPSPDTGDFTGMGGHTEAAHQTDNIDPIGEADLFLNFGRDAQAEEILKEALQTTPNDHRIHLKLLGIYANRVDTNTFSVIAQKLRDSGDADAWQQAVAMGRKLEPNNPMYGGSGTREDTVSATIQAPAFNTNPLTAPGNESAASSVLDFDIDLSSASAKNETPSPEKDFLGDAGQNAIMTFDILSAGQAPEMDLNVAAGQSNNGQAEAASPDTGDMIFDVGDSFAPKQEAQPEVAKHADTDDGGMEFTIDFPVGSTTEKSVPDVQSAGISLEGINLNFDEAMAPAEPTAGGKDEHWQEVATKLDLAKAYQEMGDASGAREILEEVLREGDEEQRETAQMLINQLD